MYAGGEVHVAEIPEATDTGGDCGRGERPSRGHRLLHLRDGGAAVLRGRARVPVFNAVQVRAQTPGAVAVEA